MPVAMFFQVIRIKYRLQQNRHTARLQAKTATVSITMPLLQQTLRRNLTVLQKEKRK